MIDRAVSEIEALVGTAPACRALGAFRASLYRWRSPAPPPEPRPRPMPARALSQRERDAVLEQLHGERFVDASPAQVYATLLDEAPTWPRSARCTGHRLRRRARTVRAAATPAAGAAHRRLDQQARQTAGRSLIWRRRCQGCQKPSLEFGFGAGGALAGRHERKVQSVDCGSDSYTRAATSRPGIRRGSPSKSGLDLPRFGRHCCGCCILYVYHMRVSSLSLHAVVVCV